MKKILITFPDFDQYKSRIEELCSGRWQVVQLEEKCSEREFREKISDAEILFGDVPPEWLMDCKDLKWLQISWAGVGPYVDKEYLRHVRLTNASGAYGETIAEHVMGILLALARHLPDYMKNASQSVWKGCGSEWNLCGKHALILGTGDVGSHVAGLVSAFGMKVTGFCRHTRKAEKPFDRMICEEDLDDVIPTVDFICGCLPETPETIHLLNFQRLNQTKKDAILINVGRGSLIDTEGLKKLLEQGHFYGVGLDVTDPEPLPCNHPLWKFQNVIITPHVAGIGFGHYTKTRKYIWEISLENLRRYRDGEMLLNLVDYQRGY